jgi:hypothetical protein
LVLKAWIFFRIIDWQTQGKITLLADTVSLVKAF